jgi:hypothetical protein
MLLFGPWHLQTKDVRIHTPKNCNNWSEDCREGGILILPGQQWRSCGQESLGDELASGSCCPHQLHKERLHDGDVFVDDVRIKPSTSGAMRGCFYDRPTPSKIIDDDTTTL